MFSPASIAPAEANLACRLTAPGTSGLAVVRIVGPRVRGFLQSYFSRTAAVGKCVHGELREESGRVIDDPVVVLLPGGRIADLSLHGGTWIVQATLSLLQRAGFELVAELDPALLYPEIGDPLEQRILALLPRASTDLALRALLAQIDAWRGFHPTAQQLQKLQQDRALHHLLNPPTVAIVGPVNAGKSTLANRLLAQDRSIVADVPGTTRDWVAERVDLDGLPVLLIDTPGQRQTDDALEHEAITRSLARIGSADLVLLVLDATRPLEPEQAPLLARYPSALRIVNKCDQPVVFDTKSLSAICIAAGPGIGLEHLVMAIQQYFGVWRMDFHRPRWIPE
ncbi:MAG: 50S ribosome-binding GTPase [Phycisphaerae bacterium]|nr:50S ribosome-binding GTPase [Phycisphaerae bacterium]MDW8261346.1 GTPase [Phycisphaerales bacterium]